MKEKVVSPIEVLLTNIQVTLIDYHKLNNDLFMISGRVSEWTNVISSSDTVDIGDDCVVTEYSSIVTKLESLLRQLETENCRLMVIKNHLDYTI